MTPEILLREFERLSDAPDAVGRLRRLVLDLAVRGKLVEQDAADEPASELLKRIAAEKARLIKAGKIKKLAVDPINGGEAPFDIPVQWHWTRLGSVGDWGAGSTPSRTRSDFYEGNITWLKSGELNDNQCLSGSEEKLTEHAVTKGSFRVNQPGDVLIAMYGATIGKLAILAESAVTNQAVCGCTPFDGVLNRFLYIFLRSEREKFHAASEGGAQPNISKVKLVWTPFPLPPLAEQKRIVAKVDELMALCDELESAQNEREATRDRLVAAALHRLTSPQDQSLQPPGQPATPPETFQTHARFYLNDLPRLATRVEHVEALRRAVLDMAVTGQISAASATDIPASELLGRWAECKSAHKAKTGDRRNKIAPSADSSEYPIPIPRHWEVQSFENVFLFVDYRGNTPPKTNQGVPLITAKNIRMGFLKDEPREYVSDETYKKWMTRGFPGPGDLLFTTEAPLANVCVINLSQPFALAQRAICLQPYGTINSHWFMRAIMSPLFQTYIDDHASGMTARGIKAARLKPLALPVPPPEEQDRIVRRVDEIMSLCDDLETAIRTQSETSQRLLDAAIREALADHQPALEVA